jgi:mannose-6-phosphate isomerase
MTAEPQSFVPQLRNLVARYREGGASPAELDVASLVLDLYSQFPDDIGVFCPYMLNHVKLQPGESIFLGAGEPHAYILEVNPHCPLQSYPYSMQTVWDHRHHGMHGEF